MRTKIFQMATLSTLSALVFSGCYASGRPPESAKAAGENIEYGAGKTLEGTGKLIGAGVNSADKAWQTPEERRRGEK